MRSGIRRSHYTPAGTHTSPTKYRPALQVLAAASTCFEVNHVSDRTVQRLSHAWSAWICVNDSFPICPHISCLTHRHVSCLLTSPEIAQHTAYQITAPYTPHDKKSNILPESQASGAKTGSAMELPIIQVLNSVTHSTTSV